MKNALIIFGIILTGILIMVLILTFCPDLFRNNNKYHYSDSQTPKFPDYELHLVTEPQSFWDKVKSLQETTVPEDEDNIPPETTDIENSTPVTTIPE